MMSTVDRRNLLKIIWVYLAAFILIAFGLHAEASKAREASLQGGGKSLDKKKETKKGKGTPMFAIFETNKGSFKIKLFAEEAPITVANFAELAEGTKEWLNPKTGKKEKKPFYDGLIFHRVIPNFMIQGGCPKGDGTGDPGYRFGDEFSSKLSHNKPGLLSMANAGPGTNGSQFFVTVAATPWLDGKHTIFGEVVEGMDLVHEISKVKTGMRDKPAEDVVIKSLKIERK
jgi:peptidyl-prolyl cis-trans isomerase A (cyclophilin A)